MQLLYKINGNKINNLLLKDIDIQEICYNMYVHVHVACKK